MEVLQAEREELLCVFCSVSPATEQVLRTQVLSKYLLKGCRRWSGSRRVLVMK